MNGTYYIRDNRIYIQATIDGKNYKKSLNKEANPLNLKWIQKQNIYQLMTEKVCIKKEPPKEASFLEFGLRILALESVQCGIATQNDYKSLFYNKILPYFQNIKISNITSTIVREFFIEINATMSNDRCKRVKHILLNILESAFEENIISSNIAIFKNIKNFSFSHLESKSEAYTVTEAAKILNNAMGWLKVFLELSFKKGLRTGETIGLKWNDLDLENKVLRLQRSITKGEITISSKQKNHFREIYLDDGLVKLIKAYKEFAPSQEWLFVNKYKQPYATPNSINKSHFKPLLKELEIEYKALYATRRTHISILHQSDKISLEDIQEQVGHKKGSHITLKHYNKNVLSTTHKVRKANEQAKIFNAICKIDKEGLCS